MLIFSSIRNVKVEVKCPECETTNIIDEGIVEMEDTLQEQTVLCFTCQKEITYKILPPKLKIED